jgi:glutathione S-transferase
VLNVLEEERGAMSSPLWFGDRFGHADIMVACALRSTGDALVARNSSPRAVRPCRALRGDADFCEIVQRFIRRAE